MSFGIGIMDVVGVTRFAWSLYKALRDSSEDFRRVASEVGALHTVLLETEDLLRESARASAGDGDDGDGGGGGGLGLDAARRRRLAVLTECCRGTLADLQRLLDHYESLGTSAQRSWDRMRWGLRDLSDVRMRLVANAATLGAFTSALNSSSFARMDRRLAKFMTEVRAGLREGSVVTAPDAQATLDAPGVWEQLRRELEDVGIGEAVIEENRAYIAAWFKDTLQGGGEGGGDDDDGGDDGNGGDGTPSLSGLSTAQTLSVDAGRISPTTVPTTVPPRSPPGSPPQPSPRLSSDGSYRTRDSSVTSMRSAMDGFALDVQRKTATATDVQQQQQQQQLAPLAPPLASKARRASAAARLLGRLLQKDDAIIQAASDGDIHKVARLIGLGMNVNARDRWGMCGYGGYTDVARLLLAHGADLDNVDVDGESPEDLARNRGNREMVLVFEEARRARRPTDAVVDRADPRRVEV